MAGAPYGIVMGLAIVFMNIWGDAIIPAIILATVVPTLLGAIFILFTKVKETNATKLD
jgi:energy-converting hydrogenase Eha subunit A